MDIRTIAMLIFTISCVREPLQNAPSRDGMPDQESWDVNIILTDEGLIRAKVRSGHLEKYNEKEFIFKNSSMSEEIFILY